MVDEIRELILSLGADKVGIANVERFTNAPEGFHPRDIFEGCQSVVVYLKRIPRGMLQVNPRIIYQKVKDVSMVELERIGYLTTLTLEKMGAVAVPVPTDDPYDFWDAEKMEGRGVLSLRHAGFMAGLGTLGKSTLLLNQELGNLFHIGAVLTNLPLKSDPLAEAVCIEGCEICLRNCPSKALTGETVIQKRCRERAYSVNERGFDVTVCNQCRVLCPRNKVAL